MTLPKFTYHPDPLSTGSIEPSSKRCMCCGEARGYIYTGPVYAVDDLSEGVCPWCIADGSVHEKFDAEFTDAAGIGGNGEWDKVSDVIRDEVAHRTPGFSGWQQEQWWTHCSDAAEFLGRVGHEEAHALGQQLLDALDCGYVDEEREAYLKALDRDHGPTGYAFRCRHCGALGGYSDDH
jgi:uncharacterized protein CbrC (UPF0167 family)